MAVGWAMIGAAIVFGLLAVFKEDEEGGGIALAFVSLCFLALGIANLFK